MNGGDGCYTSDVVLLGIPSSLVLVPTTHQIGLFL